MYRLKLESGEGEGMWASFCWALAAPRRKFNGGKPVVGRVYAYSSSHG